MIDIFRDEKGVTTVSMAVALFLSLAMVFSGLQTYRAVSAAADMQDVADAAALAAQNEVADFYTIANVCDAAILSLTLTSGVSYGLGIVAACVPSLNTVGAKLIEFGQKTQQARDNFSSNAKSGLAKLQMLLPYIASAKALSVARANNETTLNANYFAVSILVSQSGVSPEINLDNSLASAGDEITGKYDSLAQQASEAEEACKAANEAKERAYNYDCGVYPNRCMEERATKLSNISSVDNPHYSSVDAWSFDVGLSRVKAYYTARLNSMDDYNNAASVKEKAQVILQKRFYAYALEELEKAYIFDDGENFEYYLPKFYKNMEEFRQTSLYNESIYPITYSGETKTMHAWDGCPNASGASEVGSPSILENEHFEICGQCDFEFRSISNIASANTSITTGFEYYYVGFRQAVADYKNAYDEARPALDAAKSSVNGLLDSLKDIFANAQNVRINVTPPGANGNITIAVNVGKASLDTGIEGIFLNGGTTLGTRAAVSAAGLASDSSSDGGTIITNLLDGFDLGTVGSSVESLILGVWSNMLKAYSDGQSAVSGAMQNALSSMPTNTVSNLGNWASGVVGDVVNAAGLAPADVDVKKAVLVNTARVANKDVDGFGVKFLEVKRKALSSSSSSTDAFAALLEASGISSWLTTMEEKIQVAKIEFPIGGVDLPITITLPDAVKDSASGLLSQVQEAIKQSIGSAAGGNSWQ